MFLNIYNILKHQYCTIVQIVVESFFSHLNESLIHYTYIVQVIVWFG